MAPYDWTRIDPQAPVAPARQRAEPGRWLVSMLAAAVVGGLAFMAALVTYVIALTVLGVADVVPSGIGATISLLVGVAAAVFTWRGIRTRWHRTPPGRETRWG